MTTLLEERQAANRQMPPRRRLWTAEEYERAGALGLFRSEERLELIEGEIIEKMSPQGSRHAGAIRLVEEALRLAFAVGFDVRVQLPLAFGPHNRPEPDVAVVPGSIRQYVDAHPTAAALVIEVADTTLQTDRTIKAAVYAAAGVQDYWIVNLVDSVLEVYRQPAPLPDAVAGYPYGSVTRLTADQSITALAAPHHSIAVADLLP